MTSAADRLVSAIAAVKHLPGKHDQRAHGRPQGGKGGGGAKFNVDQVEFSTMFWQTFFDNWLALRQANAAGQRVILADVPPRIMTGNMEPSAVAPSASVRFSASYIQDHGDNTADAFKRLSFRVTGKELTPKDMQDAYSGGLELLPPGFHIDLNVGGAGNQIVAQGIIYDSNGNNVGRFTRMIAADAVEGESIAHHAYFTLDKEYTGTGYGSEMFYKSEDAYRQWGIDAIKTHADIDVGGYAWARMGFDFDDSGGESVNDVVGSYQVNLKKAAEPELAKMMRMSESRRVSAGRRFPSARAYARIDRIVNARIDKLRYPYEFASFTLKLDGKEIPVGKQFMLGRDWFAVKRLSTRTPNIYAGDAYREIRLKKKHIKKSAVSFEDAQSGDYNDSEALDAVTSAADEAWRQQIFEKQPELLVDVVLDDDVELKAGTSAGARAGWARRQRTLTQRQRLIDDLKARAAQTRDAKLMARANLLQANLDVLQGVQNTAPTGKHLPGKHNQKTHGRPSVRSQLPKMKQFGLSSHKIKLATIQKLAEDLKIGWDVDKRQSELLTLLGLDVVDGKIADSERNKKFFTTVDGARQFFMGENGDEASAEKFADEVKRWTNGEDNPALNFFRAASGLAIQTPNVLLHRGFVDYGNKVFNQAVQTKTVKLSDIGGPVTHWSENYATAKDFSSSSRDVASSLRGSGMVFVINVPASHILISSRIFKGYGNEKESLPIVTSDTLYVTGYTIGRPSIIDLSSTPVNPKSINKHLPGRHDQQTHGRDTQGRVTELAKHSDTYVGPASGRYLHATLDENIDNLIKEGLPAESYLVDKKTPERTDDWEANYHIQSQAERVIEDIYNNNRKIEDIRFDVVSFADDIETYQDDYFGDTRVKGRVPAAAIIEVYQYKPSREWIADIKNWFSVLDRSKSLYENVTGKPIPPIDQSRRQDVYYSVMPTVSVDFVKIISVMHKSAGLESKHLPGRHAQKTHGRKGSSNNMLHATPSGPSAVIDVNGFAANSYLIKKGSKGAKIGWHISAAVENLFEKYGTDDAGIEKLRKVKIVIYEVSVPKAVQLVDDKEFALSGAKSGDVVIARQAISPTNIIKKTTYKFSDSFFTTAHAQLVHIKDIFDNPNFVSSPKGLSEGIFDKPIESNNLSQMLDVVKSDVPSYLIIVVDESDVVEKSQPSQAQIEAGNYKKKHIDWNGLDVSIENEAGSTRTKTGKDGKTWSTKMHYDYGYIKRTEGVDGDHVDVYLGPDKSAENVYVVHQAKPATGEYDEDKCMMGFADEDAAKAAYLTQYDSPKYFGAMSSVPFSLFKEKVLSDQGEPIVPDAKRLVAGERLKSLIAKMNGAYPQPLDPTELVTAGGSDFNESTTGLSLSRAAILKEIEENGAHMSDVFWMQWCTEIVEMEHEGLVETLDVSGYGQLGQTVRTLKLTPKGRLMMLVGSRQATPLGKHLPGKHNQKTHGHILYHGTAADNTKEILKRGIVTNTGVQNWDKEHFKTGGGRGQSVYMTTDVRYALRYGYTALNALRGWGSRGKVAIFKIKVPAGAELKIDEKDQMGHQTSWRHEGKIPPEWIIDYTIVSQAQALLADEKIVWTSVTKAIDSDVYYVPVVVSDEEQTN